MLPPSSDMRQLEVLVISGSADKKHFDVLVKIGDQIYTQGILIIGEHNTPVEV